MPFSIMTEAFTRGSRRIIISYYREVAVSSREERRPGVPSSVTGCK